jgi:hypothetical protein
MKRALAAVILFCSAAASVAAGSIYQQQMTTLCGAYADLSAALKGGFRETLTSKSPTLSGDSFEIWQSAGGATWTAVRVMKEGGACIAAGGTTFQVPVVTKAGQDL